jgi:hypothetical protein
MPDQSEDEDEDEAEAEDGGDSHDPREGRWA